MKTIKNGNANFRKSMFSPLRGMALALLFLMGLAACQQNDGTQNANAIPKSTTKNVSTEERKTYFHQNFPLLTELCAKNPDLERLLVWYIYAAYHPEAELKKKQDYALLFDMRHNRVIPDMEATLAERVKNKDYDFLKTTINEFERELNAIGLQSLRTPTKIGIGAYPILEDMLPQKAGKMVRLYARFQNAAATARKGEHRYMDLSGEIDVVGLGEKIYKAFPKHKYTKTLKPDFEVSLSALTDFHRVVYNDVPNYVVGGLTTKPFPNITNPQGHEAFLKKYPKSRYAPIVRKMLDTPSELAVAGEAVLPIFLVVAKWTGKMDFGGTEHPCKGTVELLEGYLKKGMDITHPVVLTRNGEEHCAVVHRFFPDRARAEKALAELKKMESEAAGIVKATYNPETFGWQVVE